MRKILLALFSIFLLSQSAFALDDSWKTLIGTGFSTRAAYTADGNGTTYCFTDGRMSDWVFWLDADYVSGSSTLDVRIEHSPDGTNWKTVDSFTQVTTSDSIQDFHVPNDSTHLMRCIRAVVDVGAAGSPNYNVLVRAHYRLAQ